MKRHSPELSRRLLLISEAGLLVLYLGLRVLGRSDLLQGLGVRGRSDLLQGLGVQWRSDLLQVDTGVSLHRVRPWLL